MADSFFLPPNVKRVPPPERTPEIRSAKYRQFLWYWRGTTPIIADVEYQGGRWHGPLTAQQITDITAAGFGSRIFTVDSSLELPANIPEDIV
jgi:hypothetical protein